MQHVLVIDDDPTVRSVLTRGLAYESFAVGTAGTGSQGLTIARDHKPDLVILDVMLPGFDGYDVLRRLRSADEDVPVLMFTARDEAADRLRWDADVCTRPAGRPSAGVQLGLQNARVWLTAAFLWARAA